MWDYDLADEADEVLATGPTSIDAATFGANAWGVIRPASTITFSKINGTGIRIEAGAAILGFTAVAQPAPHYAISMATLKSVFGFDDRARLQFDLYFSASVLTGTAFIANAIHGLGSGINNGQNRMVSTQRAFAVGVNVSQYQSSAATSSNYTSAPGPTANVLSTLVSGVGNSYEAAIGELGIAPDFNPDLASTPLVQIGAGSFTYTNTFGPFVHSSSRWAVALATPSAVAGSSVTLRRMRLVYTGTN